MVNAPGGLVEVGASSDGGSAWGGRAAAMALFCLFTLELEEERRERKRAGGAKDFGRGIERRAGLGLLVDWTHIDGQTPASVWRAAATATVELNQGSVSMAGKNSEFEPLFLPKSYCNISIDQYKS